VSSLLNSAILVLANCCVLHTAFCQTVIWQETFDGTGNWNTLNIPAGSEGCNANPFFISCLENGNPAGVCGSGCGSNNTLHVASIAFGDTGAAYDAGGGPACGGLFACIFGGLCNTLTNRRSRSATISTVGYSGIDLEFDYIESGSGSADNATVEYSTNNGSTWTLLTDMPKTVNTGCGGQGRWTHISTPLPASCENISTLRIAFHWVNNNDGAGTDPSFAVNDVMITYLDPLPVELVSFLGTPVNSSTYLNWSTATENDNDHFVLDRSVDGREFHSIGTMDGAGTTMQQQTYSFWDHFPISGMNFYRLRQVDHNGHEEVSPAVAVMHQPTNDPLAGLYVDNGVLVTGFIEDHANCTYRITDAQGRMIKEGTPRGDHLNVDMNSYMRGLYVLQLNSGERVGSVRFVR